MDVNVDVDACLGYAICVGIAPEYFELDQDGTAQVTKARVEPPDEDRMREAAAVCPQLAIRLIED